MATLVRIILPDSNYHWQDRLINAALKWETARGKTILHDATEQDFAKYHRTAERLATAVRVYRRKHVETERGYHGNISYTPKRAGTNPDAPGAWVRVPYKKTGATHVVYECACEGCWDCEGHQLECTCDVDWDALAEHKAG